MSQRKRMFKETDRGKIEEIIIREMEKEIFCKQDEVLEITNKIEKALRNLDILKYVATVNYYENNSGLSSRTVGDQEDESRPEKAQTQIHPSVKKLLPTCSNYANNVGHGNHVYETRNSKRNSSTVVAESAPVKDEPVNGVHDSGPIKNENNANSIKMPQYIPPLPNPDIVPEVINSSRAGNTKAQFRLIVGNISKWIPPDTREDNSTHKWMVYVRSQNKDKDVIPLIRKIRYFLHESYKPHDIIDVTSAPFHLTRRGWGEFPVRVQLHFHHPLNKPVDIIHHLKLDNTCSGAQTLGAETVVELCLHRNRSELKPRARVETAVRESELDSKKPLEKGDVFDGNLLLPANEAYSQKIKNEMVKKENPEKYSNYDKGSGDNSRKHQMTKPRAAGSNNSLILDRRKLMEIIEREHDYLKSDECNEVSSLEMAGNSFLKLINGKNDEDDAVLAKANQTVFGSVKRIGVTNPSLGRIEVFLNKGEGEIFKTLKSAANKMEGETQSKYHMKSFKHSYLVNVLQRVHASKLKTVESLAKWFFKRWPIITKLALDPTYKQIHPYSCPTEEEFFQYNIGKQRSAEWFRAKTIQKILLSVKPIIPIEEEIWTTKQIVIWSRFHGYSPISVAKTIEECKQPIQRNECTSKKLISNFSSSDTDCESSDNTFKKNKSKVEKLINGADTFQKKKNHKKGKKRGLLDDSPIQAKNYRQMSTYSDPSDNSRYGSEETRVLDCGNSAEVDVVQVENEVHLDDKAKGGAEKKDSNLVVTTASSEDANINNFVKETVRNFGIKLRNEEILPQVMSDSVVRVLSQSALSFMDELLRKSLAQAWQRNGDRPPSSLEYNDVLAALMENPQFDIFTNRGLRSQATVKKEQ